MCQMEQDKEDIARELFEKKVISGEQFADVKAYRSLGIFSLHNELQFLLYASVLLFTSGAGILIYQNIDTIGHTIILAILLALSAVCFYFSFKKTKGFRKEEADFENPLYNYLVLLATILSCTFIGYFQYQYEPFGSYYEVATAVAALVALASAYYFDNRSALSIGITGLAATIGITVTPKALLGNDFFDNAMLFYYGIALALALILWTEYSEKTNLKKHFNLFFITFALHLTGICCITGMINDYWFIYSIFLLGLGIYFYRKSYALSSVSVFVFVLLYGFIGLNIVLFRLLEFVQLQNWEIFTFLLPLYFIGSIVLFITAIKKFNKETDDSHK